MHLALEAAEQGAWEYDILTDRGFWDSRCLALFGLTTEKGEMSREEVDALVHPDDVDSVHAAYVEALDPRGSGLFDAVHRVIRPGGGVVWLAVRGKTTFREEDGRQEAVRLIGTVREVTATRSAQQAVVESENRLRTIFSSIDEGYCLAEIVCDETGSAVDYRFLEVNPLFEQMTGLADAAGRTALELVPNLERYWIEKYAAIAFGERAERFESGSEEMGRWFDVFAVPVQPRGRFALVFKDVTQRKQAEEAIKSSEARFRHMADHAPAVLWLTDAEGRCTFLSAGWKALTGQTPSDGLGTGWLAMVHPEDRAHAAATFYEANARRESFRIDYRLQSVAGDYRWAIDEARPRFGAGGEYLGFIGSVVDIDERKRAEQHRSLLVDELNHRVKNTLAVVQSLAAQTFRNSGASEEARAAFDGRLGALAAAHNLLTNVSWDDASLGAVAEMALEVCGPARSRVEISGPPVPIGAKPAVTFAMALHELCTNAIKYGALSTEMGRVEIAWTFVDGVLDFQWRETGGPPVRGAPATRGFGLVMIERALAQDLRGSARLEFVPTGVVCTIRARLEHAERGL